MCQFRQIFDIWGPQGSSIFYDMLHFDTILKPLIQGTFDSLVLHS